MWIREGIHTSSGFGYLHFQDHNIEINPVVIAIEQSPSPSRQSNGKYQYVYKHRNNGQVDQYIYVIVDRDASHTPDGADIGVITAYCQDAKDTYQAECPDWVNSL